MKTLESERLCLRSFREEDAADLYAYAKLDTVGPNAGWAPHATIRESREILRKFITDDDVWALELKQESRVIGSVGLHARITTKGEKVYELGYVLSTPYEGHGYMTEAVKRVLAYAFDELNLPYVKVAHFVDNDKSRRVIERCGFRFEQTGIHQSASYGPKQSKIYMMTQNEYRQSQGGNEQ